MKTLWSVSVFGLVPIPPTDAPTGKPHDLLATRDNGHSSPVLSLCRPIVKRMATEEELARIREELEKIDAEAARCCQDGGWRRTSA
jgi:hypothetical protein